MSLFARFVLALAVVEAASAQGPNLSFTTYSAPAFSGQVGPYGIIAGSDGALWFQGRFDQIGRITTDGQVTAYPIPHSLWWSPGSIAAGPDGAVWFTEFRVNKIARITGDGAVTEYDTPAEAGAITTGPDGALWFSEGNKIGRMTTAGVVTEYPLPDPNTGSGGIAAGPDGAVWFIESTVNASVVNGQTTFNKIGRITTDGAITEYDLPPATWFQGAWFIVAGPDGAMWFNEYYAGKIGRITTAGVVTEYPVGLVGGSGPTSVAVGPDGALWFPESNDDFAVHALGRIATDGVVTEYDVPTQSLNYSAAITAGPDGALWFTDGWTNRIMRAAFTPGMVVGNIFLPYGVTDVSYSARLFAHGGREPYTWSIAVGSLPAGLSLNPSTGVIGGTPSSPTQSSFTVQVTDSSVPALSATQTLSIPVRVP